MPVTRSGRAARAGRRSGPAGPARRPRTPPRPGAAARRPGPRCRCRPGERGDDLVGVAAVGGQELAHRAVVRERLQGLIPHGVDGERGGQRLHVQHVTSSRILDRGRGPQQPLRPGALVGQPRPAGRDQQLPVGPVGLLGHGDAQAAAELVGHPVGHRRVPAGHEQRGHRAHRRVQFGPDPALHPPQVGLGRGPVLLRREEQGHVHRHSGVDALLDRRQALGGARDLDEQIAQGGLTVQALGLIDGARGVVRQQRGHL
jgi:hypothetical protein